MRCTKYHEAWPQYAIVDYVHRWNESGKRFVWAKGSREISCQSPRGLKQPGVLAEYRTFCCEQQIEEIPALLATL
jgi:hypothetical protein